MNTTRPDANKRTVERETRRLIDQIAASNFRQTMRAGGLTADSPPRRRHDLLARRVMRMIKRPVHTWRVDLLDELLDAQADIRARFKAVELFIKTQATSQTN